MMMKTGEARMSVSMRKLTGDLRCQQAETMVAIDKDGDKESGDDGREGDKKGRSGGDGGGDGDVKRWWQWWWQTMMRTDGGKGK